VAVVIALPPTGRHHSVLLDPGFDVCESVQPQLARVHAPQVRLHMALKMAQAHAKRFRRFLPGQQ
jgi:hypothetical protein